PFGVVSGDEPRGWKSTTAAARIRQAIAENEKLPPVLNRSEHPQFATSPLFRLPPVSAQGIATAQRCRRRHQTRAAHPLKVRQTPDSRLLYQRQDRFSVTAQAVLHWRWHRSGRHALDQAVCFELAQLLGQHLVRNRCDAT